MRDSTVSVSNVQRVSRKVELIVRKSGGAETCAVNNEKQALTPFR